MQRQIIILTIVILGLASFTNTNQKTCIHTYFPRFFFKVNSTDYYDQDPFSHHEPPDSLLNLLLATDSLNPSLSFEIVGFSDFSEKKPVDLSIKRAERIKTELVKRGADPKRWLIVGLGTSRPLVPLNEIKSESNQTKKDSLRTRNRRVIFRLATSIKTKEQELREQLKGK